MNIGNPISKVKHGYFEIVIYRDDIDSIRKIEIRHKDKVVTTYVDIIRSQGVIIMTWHYAKALTNIYQLQGILSTEDKILFDENIKHIYNEGFRECDYENSTLPVQNAEALKTLLNGNGLLFQTNQRNYLPVTIVDLKMFERFLSSGRSKLRVLHYFGGLDYKDHICFFHSGDSVENCQKIQHRYEYLREYQEALKTYVTTASLIKNDETRIIRTDLILAIHDGNWKYQSIILPEELSDNIYFKYIINLDIRSVINKARNLTNSNPKCTIRV
jgi:hypothetical protein